MATAGAAAALGWFLGITYLSGTIGKIFLGESCSSGSVSYSRVPELSKNRSGDSPPLCLT